MSLIQRGFRALLPLTCLAGFCPDKASTGPDGATRYDARVTITNAHFGTAPGSSAYVAQAISVTLNGSNTFLVNPAESDDAHYFVQMGEEFDIQANFADGRSGVSIECEVTDVTRNPLSGEVELRITIDVLAADQVSCHGGWTNLGDPDDDEQFRTVSLAATFFYSACVDFVPPGMTVPAGRACADPLPPPHPSTPNVPVAVTRAVHGLIATHDGEPLVFRVVRNGASFNRLCTVKLTPNKFFTLRLEWADEPLIGSTAPGLLLKCAGEFVEAPT